MRYGQRQQNIPLLLFIMPMEEVEKFQAHKVIRQRPNRRMNLLLEHWYQPEKVIHSMVGILIKMLQMECIMGENP